MSDDNAKHINTMISILERRIKIISGQVEKFKGNPPASMLIELEEDEKKLASYKEQLERL